MFKQRLLPIAFLAVFAAMPPTHIGHAEVDEDLETCAGQGNLLDVVRSCSQSLEAGKRPDRELFVIYLARGNAYGQMGDHLLAIDDLDHAIELDTRINR